jgi:DNA repair exonuclease SbcCD ATPase subunit
VSLYGYVGVIAPGLSLSRRDALVAAARSIGVETSVDSAIEELRSELRSLSEPVPSRADARRRVAETESQLQARRERVATIRGRMQEADDGDLEAEYRAAIRALSEAETEHAAATEALAEARERARRARDSRDRMLRLEDRLGNLKRRARRELVAEVTPAVDAAVSDLPDREADSFRSVDPVSAALALVRVGRIERPIVLACRRFPDRDSAERWLRAPVYRI